MIVFADCQPLWWDIPAHSTLQDAFLHEIYIGTTPLPDTKFLVDEIPLQVLATAGESPLFSLEFQDGTAAVDITSIMTTISVNADVTAYVLKQSNQTPYFVTYIGKMCRFSVLTATDYYASNWFAFTDCDDVITDNAVLRYKNSTNVVGYNTLFYDVTSAEFDKRLPFTWRVPAGLKPQGFAPLLDSDEFRNQRQESVSLYSLAYGKYVLTIGHAEGVPYYYADLLNKIFSLDSVELYDPDADVWREVRRSGNAVPQLAETYTGSGMFHITLEIELVQPQIELS